MLFVKIIVGVNSELEERKRKQKHIKIIVVWFDGLCPQRNALNIYIFAIVNYCVAMNPLGLYKETNLRMVQVIMCSTNTAVHVI